MNYLEAFNNIQTFIFDVDGVLAENGVMVMENGHLVRRMNTRDAFAIRMAVELEYNVGIITGGNSKGVIDRLRELGVKEVYAGVRNKMEAYEEFIYTYELNSENILYMGDDLPDYEVMRKVAMPACPCDATQEIKAISRYISPFAGGHGCARDVIEKVLALHDKWSV